MPTKGIRGATTAAAPEEVPAATVELLGQLAEVNRCRPGELAGVIFTVTADLEGTNPARATRLIGWGEVPVLVTREHNQELPRCIRVLILWNTDGQVRHVYLREAEGLRPDRAG